MTKTKDSDRLSRSARQRPHSRDFSMEKCGRKTDSSFAAACDVNAIVKHYNQTGLDPYEDRKASAAPPGSEAPTMIYDEAMRLNAEMTSAFNEQPASVRSAHADAFSWYEELTRLQAVTEAPEASPVTPDEPAPQDATDDNSEAKVQ